LYLRAKGGLAASGRLNPFTPASVRCCKQETGVGTAALFAKVLMSRKTCEECGSEFLIVDDVPTKLREQ